MIRPVSVVSVPSIFDDYEMQWWRQRLDDRQAAPLLSGQELDRIESLAAELARREDQAFLFGSAAG